MLDLYPCKCLGLILSEADVEGVSNHDFGFYWIDLNLVLIVDQKTNLGFYRAFSLILSSHNAKMAQGHLILLAM